MYYWLQENKVRVTLLSRRTKYRNILNEEELKKELKKDSQLDVSVVVYKPSMPFLEQVEVSLLPESFILKLIFSI